MKIVCIFVKTNNMKRTKFVEKFVLACMIHRPQANIEWAIETAHNAYDTIHGKINISSEIVDIAKQALSHLKSGKYITQNDDGFWTVFESQSVLNPTERMWCNQNETVGEAVRFTRTESGVTRVTEPITELVGKAVKFLVTKAPNDYTKEFYLISDILNHD